LVRSFVVADAPRARKLAKRIAQIVASALEHEVKDPRLARVTITDARVTADLHDATVYYTVLGDNLDAVPDIPGAAAALESAKGVLRSMVGAGTGVRFTPTLTFIADTVPEDVKHIDDLLARAAAADAEVARLANGAKPAGDPDPYRAPREEPEAD
jgi:ribosome-binding factor A